MPATHAWVVVSQVAAAVNVLPLHEAAAQSVLAVQPTQPLVLHAGVAPLHVAAVPATQLFDVLHVAAGLNVVPLHDAAGQSELVLHWTQPVAALQAPLPGQVCGVPATQVFVALHVLAGVYVAPLHAAAAQSVEAPQATQLPAPSQTLPPLSVHAVSSGASAVPQQPAVQVAVRHLVAAAGQSVGLVQAVAVPQEGLPPVPVLLLAVAPPVLLLAVAPPVPVGPAPPAPPRTAAAAGDLGAVDGGDELAARRAGGERGRAEGERREEVHRLGHEHVLGAGTGCPTARSPNVRPAQRAAASAPCRGVLDRFRNDPCRPAATFARTWPARPDRAGTW